VYDVSLKLKIIRIMANKSLKEVLTTESGSLVEGSNILSQADRIPITACGGGGGRTIEMEKG